MAIWASGDSLTPSTLNLKMSSAASVGGFSTNTLAPESGNSIAATTTNLSLRTLVASSGISARQLRSDVEITAPAVNTGSSGIPFSIMLGAASAASFSGGLSSFDTVVIGRNGTAIAPVLMMGSENSLGWYRSAASHMALSYGTLQVSGLATSSETSLGLGRSAASHLALSYGTLVASGSSLTNLRVGSGASFGGTTYFDVIGAPAGKGIIDSEVSIQMLANADFLATSRTAVGAPGYAFASDAASGLFRNSGSQGVGIVHSSATVVIVKSTDEVAFATAHSEKMAIRTSTISISAVTLDLSRAKLSLATTGTSQTSLTVGVEEIKLFIGGASGASLCIRSGGTLYFIGSSVSTVG